MPSSAGSDIARSAPKRPATVRRLIVSSLLRGAPPPPRDKRRSLSQGTLLPRCCSPAPDDVVVKPNDPVGVASDRSELQWDEPMPLLNQGYALADESRDHMNDELVDLPFIQKRGDDSAAPHHPDIFARHGPKASGEVCDRLP